MTLQHIKDILTIAREGSITRASHILFRAQSNLSTMVREAEKELNITIFERTPTGVRLTHQGEQFVACASTIVSQMEKLENISGQSQTTWSMGISVCRASYCVRAVSDWMNQELGTEHKISLRLHETNTHEAIEQVFRGESALGIIRIPSFYENYYRRQLESKNLCCDPLMDFYMMLILRADHPLAFQQQISQEELYAYTEIVHGDQQELAASMDRINPLLRGIPQKRIYVYDRGSQIDLLQRLPGTYMWVSPIPLDMVDDYGMYIRRCSLSTVLNRDFLIWRKEAMEDSYLRSCAAFLRQYAQKLQQCTTKRLDENDAKMGEKEHS
ncbi:MAG: LysR family transcriptional regulator [Massiliimalia sp.]|jgi:DNA-binding transcriptional LysR family regulator